MNNKTNQKTTSKTIKTLFFGMLIVAMILPFSSANVANAQTESNPQIISELNGKCLDIEGANRENLANVIMWDCHNGANQKWSKGSSVANSNADQDFKNDIKEWLEESSTHESTDNEKIEKIKEVHDVFLRESIENVRVHTGTDVLEDSKVEAAIDYIITETIKEENLKIIESENNSIDSRLVDFLDMIGVQLADASCPRTTNPTYKQLRIDINGGSYGGYSFNGGNGLYLVSYSDNSRTCERTYTLYFYDGDHPFADSFYDGIRQQVFHRTHDIESFTIKNNKQIEFDNTWSSSKDYDCLWGCHNTKTKSYSPGSTVYVSNTWNHMMDTSDTNRSQTKVSVP